MVPSLSQIVAYVPSVSDSFFWKPHLFRRISFAYTKKRLGGCSLESKYRNNTNIGPLRSVNITYIGLFRSQISCYEAWPGRNAF